MAEKIPTSIDYCYLRFATEEDVPVILEFIERLAEYEKLSHEVVANEHTLRKNLFGDSSYADVLFAVLNDKPVGFALFFHNFSTFLARPGIHLEDLFVLPDYRGKGVGKALLEYLAYLAVERDCGRLEWAVLDWNEPAIDFYKKLGAKPMEEWTTFRLTGDALKQVAKSYPR